MKTKVRINEKSSLYESSSELNDPIYSICGYDSVGGTMLTFAVFAGKVEVLEYALTLLPLVIKGRLHTAEDNLIDWLYIYQQDELIYKINRSSLVKMIKVKQPKDIQLSAKSTSPFLVGMNFRLKVKQEIADLDSICPGGFALDFPDGTSVKFDFSYVDSLKCSPTEILLSCSGVNYDQWPYAKLITPKQARCDSPLFSEFLLYISDDSGDSNISLESVSFVELCFSDNTCVVLDAKSATANLIWTVV